jgi:glycosyltransferase involved in cell wall biosynthesis
LSTILGGIASSGFSYGRDIGNFELQHVGVEPVLLGEKMKIAQIAPLMESVPPRLYGGTERIVSYLTEELVRLGHKVTLFASGDSVSRANLVPCVPTALRLDANVRDVIPYYMLMLDRVRELADEFDILHFHIDQFHFPLFRPIAHRTVTTLHGRQDLHDLKPLYVGFCGMPLISISNAQRRPVPNANFLATVAHGIPAHLHKPTYQPRGGYLAFLGRISPEKRPDRAIQIAVKTGIPLKIAAKVDKVDGAYFREKIEPLLDQPGIKFIGEINEREKTEFLGQARALLFPIDWPEPFGLSMIEAMACGTPVLAFHCGAVSEIIDPGVTGLIVETMEEAVKMLPQVLALDRRAVRRRFEERFTATRMARDYVRAYRSLLERPSVSERETVMPIREAEWERGMN